MKRFFHVWFSTKGRQPALVDEIGAAAEVSLREVAARSRVEIVERAIALDHVHLLLAIDSSQTLSTAMHALKGASARAVFFQYPGLRFDMGSNSFWQKSFGWRAIPESEVEIVRRYIRTHADRPLRHE